MSSTPTILEDIISLTRKTVEERKGTLPLSELWASLVSAPWGQRDFYAAIKSPGLSVIAEFKRRTPSAGVLNKDISIGNVVEGYEAAGASAISILTEGNHF